VKGFGLLAAAVIALIIGTAFLSNSQFAAAGSSILRNADFSRGFDSWTKGRNASVSVDPADGLRISHPAGDQTSTIVRQDVRVPHGTRFMRMRADFRYADVVQGDKPWHEARLVLVPLNGDREPIWGHPHLLVSEDGTGGWSHHEGIFPLPPDTEYVRAAAQLLDTTGRLEVRNWEVHAVAEHPLARQAQIGLMIAWGMLFIAATVWLATHLPRHRFLAGAFVLAAVAILLLPKPADNVIRPVLLDHFLEFEVFSPGEADLQQPPPDQPGPPATVDPAPTSAAAALLSDLRSRWIQLLEPLRVLDDYDWLQHALLLFGLSLAVLAFAGSAAWLPAAAFLAGFAALAEFLQIFVPGRTFSVSDMGFNLLGVAMALAVFAVLRLVRRNRRPALPN